MNGCVHVSMRTYVMSHCTQYHVQVCQCLLVTLVYLHPVFVYPYLIVVLLYVRMYTCVCDLRIYDIMCLYIHNTHVHTLCFCTVCTRQLRTLCMYICTYIFAIMYIHNIMYVLLHTGTYVYVHMYIRMYIKF